MGGARTPGPQGLDTDRQAAPPAGSPDPGVLAPSGPSDQFEELVEQPYVGTVDKKWDAKARTEKPQAAGKGTTLPALKTSLDGQIVAGQNHWGQGGGKMAVSWGKASAGHPFTVTLTGELLCIVPTWDDRAQASAAAQTEWDRFVGKLKEHEEEHVKIALTAFDDLAAKLPGTKFKDLSTVATTWETELKKKQKDHDTTTKNGETTGALLDTSKG